MVGAGSVVTGPVEDRVVVVGTRLGSSGVCKWEEGEVPSWKIPCIWLSQPVPSHPKSRPDLSYSPKYHSNR